MPTNLLKIFCSAFIIAAILAGTLSAAEKYEKLATESVKSYLKQHPQAAVTIGIVDKGGTHVFGFGQLKKDEPTSKPDGETIYQIGSVTKVFTTTMLAEQVVLGQLKLTESAQKYLPADLVLPKEKDREITLEELATHHSGLPRMPQMFQLFLIGAGDYKNPYSLLGWKQIADLLPHVWLENPIGTKYSYSNLGMGLLGRALVEVTQSRDYAELVATRIIEPLKMTDTGLTLTTEQQLRVPTGYFPAGNTCDVWQFASLEGCGALYSTADDLLLFAAANVGLTKSPLADAMRLTQQIRPNRSWLHGEMGLGWHIQIDAKIKTKYVWHNGATFANTSMLFLVPAKKIGIVVLSNVGVAVDPIAVNVAMKLLSDEPKKSDGAND